MASGNCRMYEARKIRRMTWAWRPLSMLTPDSTGSV